MFRIMSAVAILCVLTGSSLALGQRSEATDKGTTLLSGMVSFSTQGGDLYESDDKRYTTITVAPGLFYFIAPGIGLGGDLSYNRISQGDNSLTSWGAGPKFGVFLESGEKVIPFLTGGINYLSIDPGEDSDNGLRIKAGGGVLIRNGHLALSIEASFIYDRFKFEGASKSTTGNTILIGIGFAGFFFK